MACQLRKVKPLIYVFCEGESGQVYTADVAVIKRPSATGFFRKQTAFSKRTKDIKTTQKLPTSATSGCIRIA